MQAEMVMQGRRLTKADLELVGNLLRENPAWHRTRLSQELCRRWNWRNAQGQLKDMAARTLLLKLERMAIIRLPAPRQISPNKFRNRALPVPPVGEPINCGLRDLQPLVVSAASPGTKEANLFNGLLAHYHYLGHRITVGENIRYLARDRHARPIACLLFGSAAWKCADRDAFIGWERATRERNLPQLTNNTRFLILPWVQVPHLASHVLGLIVRRIRADWQAKYGHPVHALETFVDCSRFKGTCYRAANWLKVGVTRGRTRNDRDNCIRVPVKDVYLYPLVKDFREALCHDHA